MSDKEFCFDHMDGTCGRGARCWFRHDLPPVDSKEYTEALQRKQIYLAKKQKRGKHTPLKADLATRLNEQYNIDIKKEQAKNFLDRNAFLVVLAPDDQRFSQPGDGRPRNLFMIFETMEEVREFCKGRTWGNTDVVHAASF